KKVFETSARISCTHCEYCVPCPKGVEIPEIFAQYNKSVQDKDAAKKAYKKIKGGAQQCVDCGKCEEKCPQQLPIREKLKEADAFFKGE
ncbi:MAG: 4Fe-4S dicluster domain-containing protein, partial [Candidatus Fimenecus sp.]